MQLFVPRDDYQLFIDIVKNTFLGQSLSYHDEEENKQKSYNLQPVLVQKYDFLSKKNRYPGTEVGRLFTELPDDFKSNARSQLYRTSGGWIDKGINNGELQEVKVGNQTFLVPLLSKPAVGIDTSGNKDLTFLCISWFTNYKAAYTYLERHLGIPKAHGPIEFKWSRLNSKYRKSIIENFELLLHMTCNAVLIIMTNALVNRLEKPIDVFIKLIDGCFTGYQHKSAEREFLRERLFNLSNETPIHCDADFRPLTTDKIVRHLVKTLANGKEYTPLHVEKLSHESEPIQITDILCGAFRHSIEKLDKAWLSALEFDSRLVGRKKKGKELKFAKCYYWLKSK